MRSAIIGAVILLGACSIGHSRSEEARATSQRNFQVGAFHAVALEGAQDVVVTVGGAPAVRADGDSETIERLDIRVENGTLKIGTRRNDRWFNFRHSRGVTVYVTAPAVDAASISGSGDMRIDRVQGQAFAGEIAGSGDLQIGDLRVQRARFEIAGSGGISAAGAAEQAAVSIAGSGDVDLARLETRTSTVSVAGSGDISVHASETVSGSVMGSGDVMIAGGAECTITRMGSGDINCGR